MGSGYKYTRVLPNISHLFKILEIFDEVPFPDGNIYSYSLSKLYIKKPEGWQESNMTVNALLGLVSDLSGSELREILENSSGNSAADQWRQKILSYSS